VTSVVEFTRQLNLFLKNKHETNHVVKAASLQFYQRLHRMAQHFQTHSRPFTIGITGGSGSGKTQVRSLLLSALNTLSAATVLLQDNYYINFEAMTPHLSLERFYHEIDFDDPAYIRFLDLVRDLKRLKAAPLHSTLTLSKLVYGTPQAKPTLLQDGEHLTVTPFIVTEGIHAFYNEDLRAQYDLKIFVDVPEPIRKARWLERNIADNRGTTDNMWQTTELAMQQYILPNRKFADLVINNTCSVQDLLSFFKALVTWLAHPQQSLERSS
jgi:uridine kinase